MKKKLLALGSRRYDGGYVTRGMFGKGGYMDGHMSLGSFRSRCYGKPEGSKSFKYLF